MRDKDLYGVLLELKAPWFVDRVEVGLASKEVHVYVEHKKGRFVCPECGGEAKVHDHLDERKWRHLDTMQCVTYVHARGPRVKCEEHGIRAAKVPWAEVRSRFTLLFERFAIEVLLEASVAAARRLLRISWDEAWAIKSRAVERGLALKERKPPKYIGIDEKAFSGGQGSYSSIICDLARGTIEWVAEDRTSESISIYFQQFTPEELHEVEGVSMDMWRAYAKGVRACLPGAEDKIIYDRFHATREVTGALDKVRRTENKTLLRAGDETLKGTKYWWLFNPENVPRRVRQYFAKLRRGKLKSGRAWAIKEALRHLWEFKSRPHAERYFQRWYFWASHSRLAPVMAAAKKLYKHRHYILNYFDHRITNATAESINGRIERLKRVANGFRNRDNFRVTLFFHLGGLQLLPAGH